MTRAPIEEHQQAPALFQVLPDLFQLIRRNRHSRPGDDEQIAISGDRIALPINWMPLGWMLFCTRDFRKLLVTRIARY